MVELKLEFCQAMAKRFTDTEKFKSDFYQSLKAPYKLLWEYLQCSCNHAGIWVKDFDAARSYIGKDIRVTEKDALSYFNSDKERVIVIRGDYWFLKDFIAEQYGELHPDNRVHASVIQILTQFSLWDKKSNSIIYNKVYDELPLGYEVFDFSFIDPSFRSVFFEWLDYKRREKGMKYKTQSTIEKVYKNLLTLSNSDPILAEKVVEKSISNAYQGLVPYNPREYVQQRNTDSITDTQHNAIAAIQQLHSKYRQ